MQHVAQFQKFFTLFFSTLHATEYDKVGRVNIPAALKQAVGIQKEIVVAGVMDKIELWPKEVYDRNLSELIEGKSPGFNLAEMAAQAFALLNDTAPAAPSDETQNVNPLYFSSPQVNKV